MHSILFYQMLRAATMGPQQHGDAALQRQNCTNVAVVQFNGGKTIAQWCGDKCYGGEIVSHWYGGAGFRRRSCTSLES